MSDLIELFDLVGPQASAAQERNRDVVVIAGAGSGKTRTLAARYVCLLDEGCLPRATVAITFTEKAAREMRNRIRQYIQEWRTGRCPEHRRPFWETVEADIDGARIGTIHSLCADLLRAHPAEAHVDPRFDVLDEGLAAALKAQAVEDTLNWAVEQPELKPLFGAFEVGQLTRILSLLLNNRLDVASARTTADIVRVWNDQILRSVAHFMQKAEARASIDALRDLQRSGDLLADAGDKLAYQVEGLLGQWSTLERALARGDAIGAARALHALRREHCGGQSGKRTGRAREMVKNLKEAYDREVQPWLGGGKGNDPPPDADLELRAAELVALVGVLFDHANSAYKEAKDLRQALDFDDLEWGALQLLQDAAIRRRWQRQTSALLVDEFQDTNERQRRIVEALSGVAEGAVGRLFVVGDAKQSIYRFRGADVTVFRKLDRAVRDRGGLTVNLDVTFRAHQALVLVLNDLLSKVMGGTEDAHRLFAVPFSGLTAVRQEPREGIRAPYVEFLCGLGESAQEARPAGARLLARRLWELHEEEKVDWGDVALFFRASTGFPAYEAALEAAGIPFATVAGRGFYDRPEIRDLLNMLRALADPWDDVAMAGLLRSPAFGLTDAALYQMRWSGSNPGSEPTAFRTALYGDLAYLAEADRRQAERARSIVERLTGLIDRVPVAEFLKTLLDQTAYPAILAAAHHGVRLQRNVEKLLADAHASGLVRVVEFLEYVDTLRESGAREGEAPVDAGGAVQLMTVHKAKGLEFPVVVIADASREAPSASERALLSPEVGLALWPAWKEAVPLSFRLAKALDGQQAEAEDRRLLYVAATRAREKLIVCGHVTERIPDAWMKKLLDAANVDITALIENQGCWQSFTLSPGSELAPHESRQEVRALAATSPEQVEKALPPRSEVNAAAMGDLEPLYRPLDRELLEPVDGDGEVSRQRAVRVTRRHRHPDGTIVGLLVHEALRRWRFPGEPGLDRLLQAAAAEAGLVDPADIGEHTDRAVVLLWRLRQDPRWAEIDQAPRQHEVPYCLCREGRTESGAIDLLYRLADGQWHIVDFKTDALADEAEMRTVIEERKYGRQMRRYREAVSRLLGGAAKTTLCFLDYAGQVRWEEVT